jgi:hypothetical protein
MSSPSRAVRRPKGAPKQPESPADGLSTEATRLAAELERNLAEGRSDALAPEVLQTLLAALCKTYAAQVAAGASALPVPTNSVTPTDVMITASGLLRSADLAVFELGLWQSWTGR